MMNTTTKRIGILAATAAGTLALVACGTPSPQVGSVDLRSGAGGAAISTAPLPEGAGAQGRQGQQGQGRPGLDGEYPVEAGNAGTVVFTVTGQQVEVEDPVLNDGWRVLHDKRDFDDVELVFGDGTSVVEVDAEIDDGRFESDVDIDSPAAPARITYPVSDAGSVTIDVLDNGFVGLVSQEAAPGWVATVDEDDLADGEVEIHFRNDGASRSVAFDANTDDGMLNIDIDSKTGFDHFVRGPGR